MFAPVLVVDDLRTFPGLDAVYARSAASALEVLDAAAAVGHVFDQIWFDHDLGDGVDIGPVLNWILERFVWDRPTVLRMAVVHTSNAGGAKMLSTCLSRWVPVRRIDATWAGAVVK